MSSLKNQQKKLLAREIGGKIMEYFMGLNEKNESVIRRIAEKSSKKLVRAYTEAIKSQYKKALKATVKREKTREHSVVHVISAEQTNLIAP